VNQQMNPYDSSTNADCKLGNESSAATKGSTLFQRATFLLITFAMLFCAQFGAAVVIVNDSSFANDMNARFFNYQLTEALVVAAVGTLLAVALIIPFKSVGVWPYIGATMLAIIVLVITSWFYIALVGV